MAEIAWSGEAPMDRRLPPGVGLLLATAVALALWAGLVWLLMRS